jgi:hypothetical protein
VQGAGKQLRDLRSALNIAPQQMAGKLVRAPVQLSVGDLLAIENDRGRVRARRRLRLKDLMQNPGGRHWRHPVQELELERLAATSYLVVVQGLILRMF